MQYESTPLRQKCDNNTTPCSTAIALRQGRKRISVRTPLQEDDHVSKVANCVDSTPSDKFSLWKATQKAESPLGQTSQQKYSSSHSQEQEYPKDVFSDNKCEPDHQLRNPAAQFHNAVKRLAFESLPVIGENVVSPSRNCHTTNVQGNSKKNAAKQCNFSRRFRTGPDVAEASINSQECDITSAKRDLSNLAACEHNLTTPVKSQWYGGPATPVSLQRNHRSVRGLPQRTIQQNRNFSRPARPLHSQTSEQSFPTVTASPGRKNNRETGTAGITGLHAERKHPRLVENTSASHLSRHSHSDRQQMITPLAREKPELQNSKPIESTNHHGTARASNYIRKEDLTDHRRQLKHWQIWLQRIIIMFIVLGINIGLGLAYFRSFKHPYLLAILVFMKSKDILSTAADLLGILHYHFHSLIWPPRKPDSRWILSLVCAYAETEEQIMKTIMSLVANITTPHRQVICIILDGKPRDILSRMDTICVEFERPYVTWRGAQGNLHIHAGTIQKIPIILIVKAKNAGKKDSLILGHDLFNYPRRDMPHSTKLLREEIWQLTMPHLVLRKRLTAFDFVFCTDADSTIHKACLQKLANALCQSRGAIAGCGVLFAEFSHGWTEFHPWHLFQQFQYTFGQYVRRQAESTFGRVTCLPGCVTMIVVRPEVGDALSEYAKPVTGHNLLRHQVQYLGTDRRLTWCMLSQNKHLRTIFVPEALSETVTPSSLSHYLSQRRRWASNAYFNDFFYLFGQQQRLVTRLFAAIDILRLTLVFYRVFNTAYFIHGLATNFYIIKIIPTLIVTKTPATWYLLLVLIKEPMLRKRLHKVLLGMIINQLISPILSVIVFVNVLWHVGSQAWGKTGASTQGNLVPSLHHNNEPSKVWTPARLAQSVRQAIQGLTPVRSRKDRKKSPQNSDSSTTSPQKSKHLHAPAMVRHGSTADVVSKAATRARSTSCLNSNYASEFKPLHPQQTPARQLFRNAYPTPSTIYQRNPPQQDDANTTQHETPTRIGKRKNGT